MRRKLYAMGIILTMSVGALAGCSGAGNQAGETKTPAKTEADSKSSSKNVKLRFLTFGLEDQYNWKETIAGFKADNPNIDVEVVLLSEKGDSSEASQKLDLAAASGETMDVVMFSNPTDYSKRASLGMLANLDSFISKDGYNLSNEYKVNTKLSNGAFGLPGKFNPWYVLLNKDHLDAAGLPVPKDWTWDQFADYAKKLTTDKHKGAYFHGPQNGAWFEYLRLFMANQTENGDLIKADGTSNINSPLFRKTLEFRLKMEKEDKSVVPLADLLTQKLNYRTQFFNQSASMIPIGSWMNTSIGGEEKNPLAFHVAVAPFPKNKEGDPTGVTPVTADYIAVAESSKNKQEAYNFVRWYTTKGLSKYGKNIPSWNGIKPEELTAIVDKAVAGTQHPELVDKSSLVYSLQVSKAGDLNPPPSYQSEVYKAVQQEFESLVLGKNDLDTTIKNMQTKVDKIISNNK